MSTLAELAALVAGEVAGNPHLEISGVSEIQNGLPGTITFLGNPRYKRFLENTGASAIIVNDQSLLKGRDGIIVANPQLALPVILAHFYQSPSPPEGIHPKALIDPRASLGDDVTVGPFSVVEAEARIGDGARIGANCYVGIGAAIGDGTRLMPGVVVYHQCVVGAAGLIHAGTVIGIDGFGFVTDKDQHHKIPQTGRVIIGDNVEMGANCTIDRGTIGDTIIESDCKFDNHVHIAHNVRIGRGCLFAGQVGVAGTVTIGEFCVFAGHTGIAPHLTIGDRSICGAKTGVTKSLAGGKIYAGMPAREIRQQHKRDAVITEVALLKKRLLKLEDEVTALHPHKDA